jgi:hypothetical protein
MTYSLLDLPVNPLHLTALEKTKGSILLIPRWNPIVVHLHQGFECISFLSKKPFRVCDVIEQARS